MDKLVTLDGLNAMIACEELVLGPTLSIAVTGWSWGRVEEWVDGRVLESASITSRRVTRDNLVAFHTPNAP
jgi:hypothetical protein